ncbi:hypothetical protein [Parasedimentitalea huanghaiensis]|uniref:Uncharacterized protein n=1 Tax=Parasedimentitalea huanghaiensis TaxID=2682100 RepID=A0A6L6WAV6_9RHOB|nr:hypothetical protein [Zongyanglinia huanghaiensis]MVO14321.1 hypothetical protein [Zongyanglinia huanghaiensis]
MVLNSILRFLSVFTMAVVLSGQSAIADISRFVGEYSGRAEVETRAGDIANRDMSVVIKETANGYAVLWTSTTEKEDGRRKTKSYEIEFQPTDRDGVYAAAMKRNVFGHTEQLDPMKGEPYVWSRITGDTLTVFSMFVAPNGDYEMQQYDRTLAEGGLQLDFNSHRNGIPTRFISTFLSRTSQY